MSTEKLDAIVLNAIKSYPTEKPAMLGDLWGMIAIQKACCYRFSLGDSLQRLKKAGEIRYSRKPAGWVAT